MHSFGFIQKMCYHGIHLTHSHPNCFKYQQPNLSWWQWPRILTCWTTRAGRECREMAVSSQRRQPSPTETSLTLDHYWILTLIFHAVTLIKADADVLINSVKRTARNSKIHLRQYWQYSSGEYLNIQRTWRKIIKYPRSFIHSSHHEIL